MIPLPSVARRKIAFSLVELLTVIALAAALLAVSLPSISQVSASMHLRTATQQVVEEIELARMAARTHSAPTEVCFIQPKGSSRFSEVRSALLQVDGQSLWLGRARSLPAGIAIFQAEEVSNVIGAQKVRPLSDDPDAPKGVTLRIYPDGRVQFGDDDAVSAVGESYYLTLGTEQAEPSAGTVLPHNFASILISPRDGRVTVSRP